MDYYFNKEELETLKKINLTDYLPPTIDRINFYINSAENKKEAWKEIFNQLYNIMSSAKIDVTNRLEERLNSGEIKDAKQAIKSIAGNTFSYAIMYIFLRNKEIGNIRPDIFITSKKSEIIGFDIIATINVDGETQKPDVDLVIYTKKQNGEVNRCIILSLKTSLRERAGQTYKWKLLMEIATTDNAIKNKYNISYNAAEMPLVCFATVNFYSEIDNPQHRGMFKFFNKSFIAKEIKRDFISPLSELVDFVNISL